MGDVRHQLRKMGFPQCAGGALQVIEQLMMTENSGRGLGQASMDMVVEIVDVFVFRGNHASTAREKSMAKPLSSLQELQLIDVMCNYFSRGNMPPAIRNSMLLFIFPLNRMPNRMSLLMKLVSAAIAIKSKYVLMAAGAWLQQHSPSSPRAVELAKAIVNDYLSLVPEATEHLIDLPLLSPDFSAYFLTAVAEYYNCSDADKIPPQNLLELVIKWVAKFPGLCTSPAANATPFLGLVRWCVLSPLIDANSDSSTFSQLHLVLLESVVSSSRENLVDAGQLSALVPIIQRLHISAGPQQSQLSIDRFIQASIVLLRCGKISGNVGDFFQQMDSLPSNDLLERFRPCRHLTAVPPFFVSGLRHNV